VVKKIKPDSNGIFSVFFSSLALIIILIQLPLGMKRLDDAVGKLVLLGFPLGIILAILGIIFSLRAGDECSIANKGLYLGIAYFVVLVFGWIFIGVILSSALH